MKSILREKIRDIPTTQEHSFNSKEPFECRYLTLWDPWGKWPLVSYCQRVRGSRLHITITQHRFQSCTGQVFISGPNEFVYWAKVLHATHTCWQQLWYSKEPVFSNFRTQYTMNSTILHKNKRNTLGFTEDFWQFHDSPSIILLKMHDSIHRIMTLIFLPVTNPAAGTVHASLNLYLPCLMWSIS